MLFFLNLKNFLLKRILNIYNINVYYYLKLIKRNSFIIAIDEIHAIWSFFIFTKDSVWSIGFVNSD